MKVKIEYFDIMKSKKYTTRKLLKEDMIICLEEICNSCFIGIFETEDTKLFAEEISEAMIQDLEVMKYSLHIWKKYAWSEVNRFHNESKSVIEEILEEIVPEMFYEEKMFNMNYKKEIYKGEEYNGLASYTYRYPVLKKYPVDGLMKESFRKMEMEIEPKLYEWAYPVFWLESLNLPFSDGKRKQREEMSFILPVAEENEKEMYLFALLLNNRASGNTINSTIFAAVKRSLNHILKSEKPPKNKNEFEDKKRVMIEERLSMDASLDRWDFVKELRKKMYEKASQTVRESVVLINNIVAIRELIEIGEKHGLKNINKPFMIILLERLTGWIGFYNYVLMREGQTCDFMEESLSEESENVNADDILNHNIAKKSEQFQIQVEQFLPITNPGDFLRAYKEVKRTIEDMEMDNEIKFDPKEDEKDLAHATFQVIDNEHIAFLYCIGKWIQKSQGDEKNKGKQKKHKRLEGREKTLYFGEAYHTSFGKNFLMCILELQNIMVDSICWELDTEKKPECGWYNKLYDELFVNDINNVQKATRFDAINFYNLWRMTEG